MKTTLDDPREGCDHVLVRVDGRVVGFKGLDKDTMALERCPVCRKQNYALAVPSGVCCWCGFDINNRKGGAG